MKIENQNLPSLLIAILVGMFGGYYSFIADVTSLFPFNESVSSGFLIVARIVLSFLLAIILAVIIFLFTRLRSKIAYVFGFINIFDRWFPDGVEERIKYSRKILSRLINGGDEKLWLVSVSGTWDICRPFTEKELRSLFEQNKLEMRVLLAHPESLGFSERVSRERNQDFSFMKNKIINNTNYLETVSKGKCRVRWYLTSPHFHILANSNEMHFSPFVDGIPGHDTRRYLFDCQNPLFLSFISWFEDTWDRALDPTHEMKWVERQAQLTRAVFLDRDNTLIKDICYFGNHSEVDVEILSGVIEGLRLLWDKGFRLIVVSNQQSVGLHINSKRELALLTKKIKNEFEIYSVYFDAFYYCNHSIAQGCNCRKPKPGLLEQAVRDYALNLSQCHFIGDSDADKGVGKYLPDLKIHIVNEETTFLEIAKIICKD